MNGCESDLSIINVLLDISKILESIYINNSMSPNQDGILDAFTIDNIQSIYKSNLQIVNRWGELVFDTKNYKNNWFGSYLKEGDSDQILPDGVYYYHFEFEIKDYPEIFKKSGYIYLKK
jgi:gliding motility-associated-like protein